MPNDAMPYGYRILGPCNRERRLVDYDQAFAAYAGCDDLARIEREGFLSPFQYDAAIRSRIVDARQSLNVTDYPGRCWSRYLWFDIDRDGDIELATADTRKLAMSLVERYRVDESELLVFFSGSKGYHIGLPTSLMNCEPSPTFNQAARRLAEGLAGSVGVAIDPVVYSKVQPLRAPNSRHGKTGRHKRIVAVDELLHIKPSAIEAKSADPLPFELPTEPAVCERAMSDWSAACDLVSKQAEAAPRRDSDRTELNCSTLEFIRDGADEGDRHRLLYSAAANLAELGCSARLAHALLTESALDSGLSPTDTRRAIDNGLNKGGAA
ncbi:DNA primase [Rubripirellula sp.]|nr:DNA primase [Rubripirellula sp.]